MTYELVQSIDRRLVGQSPELLQGPVCETRQDIPGNGVSNGVRCVPVGAERYAK